LDGGAAAPPAKKGAWKGFQVIEEMMQELEKA
jgi:hypothetical protein